jgi:hypothetical protein
MDDSDVPLAAASARRPWWRSAPVLSLGLTVLLLALALAWPLIRGLQQAPGAEPATGMPWQIEPAADGGSRVFGLVLGHSTVAEVVTQFPEDLRLALVAARAGQPPVLEAYVESYRAGFITGKLVLAFDADPAWLAAAQARSPRREIMEGGSQRFGLAAEDLERAQAAPLSALTFVPSARLDASIVQQRFGEPAERLAGPEGETQWLYPVWGLAIALPPADGPLARARAVLQYVAPARFAQRLRAPLLSASAAAG